MNDPAFRRYQHWADRRMEDLVRRMQERLKGIKPDVALVTWTTNAGRFGHFLSIPRNMPARMNLLLDAPDQEFWLDETNRGTTIVPAFANAYIWATTNHRVAFSEPYILSHGNPYGKDSFPPQEILRRMMLALTYGASPSIAVVQPPNLQHELYACLDEVQRRKPWLTHKKPEPWAALVMSDNTRNFYGRSPGLVEERYMANVLGAFRATVEEHLPVAVINDWNLNPADLAPYKVLILPNTACLDDAQVAAVERFVRAGGGLVASLDTSLFDEFGTPRADFALAEVFGVELSRLPIADAAAGHEDLDVNFAKSIGPDYWEKRKNVFDFTAGRRLVPQPGEDEDLRRRRTPSPSRGRPCAVVADEIRPRRWSARSGSKSGRRAPPEVPGVVARPHGKGRVVYFAAGFDAAYYLYAYPYQRLLLARRDRLGRLRAAAGRRRGADVRPFDRDAAVEGPARERLIVHLFNDLNTTAFHALPDDDVPLREEVVPIHDIRVKFAPRYRFRGPPRARGTRAEGRNPPSRDVGARASAGRPFDGGRRARIRTRERTGISPVVGMDELLSGGSAEMLDDLGRSQGSVVTPVDQDREGPGRHVDRRASARSPGLLGSTSLAGRVPAHKAERPGLPGSRTTRRRFLSQLEAT